MIFFHFAPFLEGFLTGASLIIAIGPQNAFVLKQALQRNHLFTVAFLCSLIDSSLIIVGVAGLGVILTSIPLLLTIARWGGALFLIAYSIKCFLSVFTKKEALIIDKKPEKLSFKKTILILLALSFLNPHMYLDTCVLLGSIGAQLPLHDRYCFALGAIMASFVWFFSLCYGAKYLLPLFENPISWKVLDFCIGCLMVVIATILIVL